MKTLLLIVFASVLPVMAQTGIKTPVVKSKAHQSWGMPYPCPDGHAPSTTTGCKDHQEKKR